MNEINSAEQDMAENNLILKIRTGSKLYGTATDNSDSDYLGVFIPNKEYVIGLKKCEQVDYKTNPANSGQRNSKTDTDMTLYSLPKYIKLCYENNPNLIETLFVDDKNLIFCNEYGKKLLNSASLFVSKRVKHKFLFKTFCF
jgi:predicted nucleotidyltransferase